MNAEPMNKLSKEAWIQRYGGQARLNEEGFDVVPCVQCGDSICHGWQVVPRDQNSASEREAERRANDIDRIAAERREALDEVVMWRRAVNRDAEIERLQAEAIKAAVLYHVEEIRKIAADPSILDSMDQSPDGLAAALRKLMQARPRVKPLEWNEYVDDKQTAIAVGAEYVVKRNWWRFCMGDQRGGPYHAASMDEAKAACEAHWQASVEEYLL